MINVELILDDMEIDELRNRYKAIGTKAYTEREIDMLLSNSKAVQAFLRTVFRLVDEKNAERF